MFAPQLHAVEYGHGFHLDTARTLQEARVYVSEIPANLSTNNIGVGIYPRGLEAASGPIRRVVIPVESVTTTGVGNFANVSALYTPEFVTYMSFDSDALRAIAYLGFNMDQYTVLTGKRVLAVNLLYAALKSPGANATRGSDTVIAIGIQNSTDEFGETVYSNGEGIPEGDGGFTGIGETGTLRLRFGDICPIPLVTPHGPWTYPAELGRFDPASASRLYVTFKTGTDFGTFAADFITYLWYAALEVLFCEEQRVAYGVGFNSLVGFGGTDTVDYGANVVPLRTLPGQALWPVLQPGDYTLTVNGIDNGASISPFTAGLSLNALRELYDIPTHPGLQLDIPYPAEDYVDREFTAIQTHVLPQISLHASGGTLTEPHAYGRLGKAPVYGGIFATQDIYDDITGVAASYPQVRFYARKYDTTTVPLKLDSTNVTGTGLSVQITPAEHDALPEIIDGWKECTLRFPTAPSMGAVSGFPAWRFSSVGERNGSQWQVLSACAPAVSGVPGSLLTQATPVHRLGTATYQPTSGDTVELTWMSPYATGAVVDPDCDAVLIFSQDPATVTGVSISQATQTVTGIGLDCGSTPCCIATGIGYNRITWGLPVNTGIGDDDFARTVAAGGWGTASDGKVYTLNGTAGDFSVNGSAGLIIPTAAANREAWVNIGGPDQDVSIDVTMSDSQDTTNPTWGGVVARLTDASNYYRATMRYINPSTVQLRLDKRVAGVETNLATVTLPALAPAATTPRTVRLQVVGTYIRAKVWDTDAPEPWWQLATTDSALTTGNNAGAFARDDSAVTSVTFTFDNLTVRPPDFAFGGIELQRWDSRTGGDFQTIMLASSPAVTGFSDYEARVATNSVYRLRNVNIYNFAGPWSTYVTGAPAAPGVSGAGACDLTGALIFTSNSDQSGARNCAYLPQWTSDPPVENFTLPEGGRVSYQELYGRDGRVAFHGTERGLEAFARNLLIHAGAVDPTVLADVTTLRDLAWADLPYVCVRDDIGNRWYANVRVPDVAAQDDKSKILAAVEIIELTREPAAVDPV